MKKDEDLRSQLDVSFTTNGLIVAQPKPPESKISNSNQTKQKNLYFFLLLFSIRPPSGLLLQTS